MPAPTKEQLLREMYTAWLAVTVLDDRSFAHFKSIVNMCIDGNNTSESMKNDGKSECSTGSIFVLSRKRDNGVIKHEIMITSTFSIEGNA